MAKGYVGIPGNTESKARKLIKGFIGKPTKYTAVEYIESSGTQYIDTGYKPNNKTKVVWDGYLTDANILFGCGVNGSYQSLAVRELNSGYYGGRVRSGSSSNSQVVSTIPIGTTRHTISISQQNGFYIDSTLIGTFTSYTFQESLNLYLFCWNASGTAGLFSKSRLYSVKIYDNNTLVRDFIPVLDENNVACLYDFVGNKYYYNKGTGTFNAGQPVSTESKARKLIKGYVGVPMSYTPVEYIESSGAEYIDTGFKPNQKTNMQIDFQYIGQNSQVSTTTSVAIAGVRQVVANNKLVFWVDRATGKVALNYGTYDSGAINNTNCSQRVVMKNEGCSLLYDGATVASSTSSDFTSEYNILLFGMSSVNGTVDLRGIQMKLYSFKIWDDNTLVKDFIPVIDQDNVVCLYEQVEGKFYYNRGTGSFTAGSAIGQPVSIGSRARLCWGYRELNYIQNVDANQYIDTEVSISDDIEFDCDFQVVSITSASWSPIAGAFVRSPQTRYYTIQITGNNPSNWGSTSSGNDWYGFGTFDKNRHTVKYNSGSNKRLIFDGSNIVGQATFSAVNEAHVYLWGKDNIDNGHGRVGINAVIRFYSVQLRNRKTQELYRDFVPILDELGVPCLLDKVSKRLFYNKGSGTLNYG